MLSVRLPVVQKIQLPLFFLLFTFFSAQAQVPVQTILTIDPQSGHDLKAGSSGFNVRIPDKVWSYNHPNFKDAVQQLKPGWLRFFSGTAGDAFNCATGLYDKDYAWMFDKPEEYMKLYAYTDVKGPHRISDLYNLLGETGGKLVVTVNAFTETPQIAAELARFCKNNNIQVEVWQFCNEPYFYTPDRRLYWWNDGYDYALKMKPYADSILKVFPDARLALNCSWDGIWDFTKEINRYQNEKGRYWNVYSKHSYAPHIGGNESFESAYRRANTKLLEVTGQKAMADIEKLSWPGAPLLITEFGVWNKVLNGIYTAVYNAEYTLRQLAHPNALYVGSHEISNKYQPAVNRNKEILDAYENRQKLNTDTMLTGIRKNDEGVAMAIVHEATGNSDHTWNVDIQGAEMVDGMKNTKVAGVYARAFIGFRGFNYLVITNRSNKLHEVHLNFGQKPLNTTFYRKYIWSAEAERKTDIPVKEDIVSDNVIDVPPFSVMLLKWQSSDMLSPPAPRIYKAEVIAQGISLSWWKNPDADKYIIRYGTSLNHLNREKEVFGFRNVNFNVNALKEKGTYFFAVQAAGKAWTSAWSDTLKLSFSKPGKPRIFKTARRDTTITIFWQSVPNASGYLVSVNSYDGTFKKVYDAKNVFGYRVEGLSYDVPYSVTVSAYNGLGTGAPSASETVTCKENIPIPPRNISATESADGIVLQWVAQDSVHSNVKYRVYRGTQPHQFSILASNISRNSYTDTSAAGLEYYYTVKSYTEDDECSFYPNIATILRADQQTSVAVESIEKINGHYEIKGSFTNIAAVGNTVFGITLRDVSYLNGEETKFAGTKGTKNGYTVVVPLSALKSGRTYAVKGFVQSNGRTPVFSLPTFKTFSPE